MADQTPPHSQPTDPPPAAPSETQARRRVKYGLNVTVAVLAAVGIVVFVNWIAYRQYTKWDMTATRAYSLSPQTHKVISHLDQHYTIVALFRPDSVQKQQITDLLGTYGRASSHLSVRQLDPDRDLSRVDAFLHKLRDRHADELKPTRQAIARGRKALKSTGQKFASLVKQLNQVLQTPDLPRDELRDFIAKVRTVFDRQAKTFARQDKGIQEALDQPLPAYGGILTKIQNQAQALNHQVLGQVIQRFEAAQDENSAPAGVRDKLLGIAKELKVSQKKLRQVGQKLEQVEPPKKYSRLVSNLSGNESVVVVGPGQVRVLNITDMFRAPSRQQVQQVNQNGGGAEMQFLGEERLTGALMSMKVKKQAMVVFVLSSRQPALGPRGQYHQVAQRLESANFQVKQWNPSGRSTAMGQNVPPQPPPQAAPGQRTIWVVLPKPPTNPMRPQASGGGRKQIAALLKHKLAQGDAALVIDSFDPAAQYGSGDPVGDFLARRFGLTAQTDRVIMRQTVQPNRQTRSTTQFAVDDWPDALPITQALSGMQAAFVQTSPLVLGKAKGARQTKGGHDKVTRYPLVVLRKPRMWAETDVTKLQHPGQASYDKSRGRDTFTVGAAAVRGKQRVVLVADPVWASDRITTYGPFGPGTAKLAGALYPGNSELFVNSVYWLARLNQLIAASPRSQDIRRIEPISNGTLTWYRVGLLAGMPVVILVAGLGVWFVRRRW